MFCEKHNAASYNKATCLACEMEAHIIKIETEATYLYAKVARLHVEIVRLQGELVAEQYREQRNRIALQAANGRDEGCKSAVEKK